MTNLPFYMKWPPSCCCRQNVHLISIIYGTN
ncbi:hypothetical protein F383_36032 [Gossypium arboreum]|uniref:Uncharacterized protein n=1 Tax=Gossypium arboreum TaxID=29729 RepID=A0A0B0NAX6_GOSAR|nr:hypothetical protein F383_36032 [Gossypium arboreum]